MDADGCAVVAALVFLGLVTSCGAHQVGEGDGYDHAMHEVACPALLSHAPTLVDSLVYPRIPGRQGLPRYSTDIAAAWEVAEKLKERLAVVLIDSPIDEEVASVFTGRPRTELRLAAESGRLPFELHHRSGRRFEPEDTRACWRMERIHAEALKIALRITPDISPRQSWWAPDYVVRIDDPATRAIIDQAIDAIDPQRDPRPLLKIAEDAQA